MLKFGKNKNEPSAALHARYSAAYAKQRLRRMLGIFFVCLIVPLYFLVVMARQKIESDEFIQNRADAEDLLRRVNQHVQELLTTEDKRPFGDYGFVNIAANALLNQQRIGFSPLAELPPQSSIPGIIGYFQVDPDGSFHSPVLPELGDDGIGADRFGWSKEELKRRLDLKDRLKGMLKAEHGFIQVSALEKQNLAPGPLYRAGLIDILASPAYAQPATNVDSATRSQSVAGEPVLGGKLAEKKAVVSDKIQIDDESLGTSLAIQQVPVSPKKLSEYNIDQRLWSNQGQAAMPEQQGAFDQADTQAEQRFRRKEKVVLPEPRRQLEELNTFFGRRSSAQPAQNAESEPLLHDKPGSTQGGYKQEAKEQEGSAVASQSSGLRVLEFEGEVDPLQFRILQEGVVAFYRKVWRNKQRYVQGFLCDTDQFFSGMVRTIFDSSQVGTISSLIIGYNGDVFRRFEPRQSRDQSRGYFALKQEEPPAEKGILLYRAFLAPPLESLEFIFAAREIPLGAGAMFVNFLVVCLSAVLLVGLWGIYRLGIGQIELAAQRSNFVSAVSHELKTPLTSIRMYAEMLRSDWVPQEEKRRSYYDYIFFESERLSRLITNVLQLSKLSNADAPLELKEYEASQLLELAKSKVQSQIQAAQFEMEIRGPVGKDSLERSFVLAEEDSFARIFINLVDNAIKFSVKAEKKAIELGYRVSADKREVTFYVRDYGPGVDRAQMKKIFQLFYRGQDEMTRTTPGTGIGLALVRELARKLGASVDLQNREPGAEFQVKFGANGAE
jgi:two-component system, OmpR family, phosphate regulon sensor histidine kinase PhoR